MNAWFAWRIVKFISLALLGGGELAALVSSDRRARMRALGLATLGLLGTYVSGYALMKATSRSLTEAWILWALVASLLSFHAVAVLAHRRGTSEWPGRLTAWAAAAGLLVAIAVMVLRSADQATLALVTVVLVPIAAPVMWLSKAGSAPAGEPEPLAELSWGWFRWIARAEGVSLIMLMLIAMPLKRATGFALDGGTGLLGWTHGVLFLVYVQALASTGRALGWSWGRLGLGFVLSLIPFGTFVFERVVRKS